MRFATCRRVACLCGKPLGRWAILQARVAMGLAVGCSALLLAVLLLAVPTPAYAQVDTNSEMLEPVMTEGAAGGNEAADAELIHVIVVGDNLTKVAQQYGVKPADLAAYNQILDFNHVVIGQKLR